MSTPADSAAPASARIPLCEPHLGGNEWRYVKECLDSTFVSSVGAFVDRFERDIAAYVGARFAVATSSGTAALHVALIVSGVEADDEVLMPALTFVAPANAARYVGAWPVFLDVEPDYWQLDVQKVAEFLERECAPRDGAVVNRSTGRRVRAILPVHVLGHPCDIAPLLELARRYGLALVEDATESLGARYRGQSTGTFGDVGCLSFNGNKIMTTGGGGMIVTNDQRLAERAKYLTTQAKDDPVEYVHGAVGFNYRLTNIQAALGCAQAEQLDAFVAAKRRIADFYRDHLAAVRGISFMREAPWASSTFWLSTILVDAPTYGMDSRALMRALGEASIGARPLWRPLHRLPPYRDAQAYAIEHADRLYRDALSLPSSTSLTPQMEARVVEQIARLGTRG